jgi:hypothetical protein
LLERENVPALRTSTDPNERVSEVAQPVLDFDASGDIDGPTLDALRFARIPGSCWPADVRRIRTCSSVTIDRTPSTVRFSASATAVAFFRAASTAIGDRLALEGAPRLRPERERYLVDFDTRLVDGSRENVAETVEVAEGNVGGFGSPVGTRALLRLIAATLRG